MAGLGWPVGWIARAFGISSKITASRGWPMGSKPSGSWTPSSKRTGRNCWIGLPTVSIRFMTRSSGVFRCRTTGPHTRASGPPMSCFARRKISSGCTRCLCTTQGAHRPLERQACAGTAPIRRSGQALVGNHQPWRIHDPWFAQQRSTTAALHHSG